MARFNLEQIVMDATREIFQRIRDEIIRLSGRADVVTFVDARMTPARIFFSDRTQAPITVSDSLTELESLF